MFFKTHHSLKSLKKKLHFEIFVKHFLWKLFFKFFYTFFYGNSKITDICWMFNLLEKYSKPTQMSLIKYSININ